jgi:hypothetical protein
MENAKVVYFEDSESLQELASVYLQMALNHIVRSALTMDQARELINQLEPGTVNVAIVDGNLTSTVHTGNDGREIVELLRAKDENIIIIGSTGDDIVEGADYQVPKVGNVAASLSEMIHDIKL